jgi:type III pantothenate kinase
MRILAVDIGNTMIDTGLFEKERLLAYKTLSTPSRDEVERIKSHLEFFPFDSAIVASVVPQITESIVDFLGRERTHIFDYRFPLNFKLSYRNPAELGADRIANAYYVFRKYKRNSIVLDFGTAITIDVVSRDGVHLGGAILPGVDISLKTLYSKTALIREKSLGIPSSFVGKSTKECLEVGILRGTEGGIRYILENIKKEMGWKRPLLIATGGNFFMLREYLPELVFDSYLTLKGLVLAFLDRIEGKSI